MFHLPGKPTVDDTINRLWSTLNYRNKTSYQNECKYTQLCLHHSNDCGISSKISIINLQILWWQPSNIRNHRFWQPFLTGKNGQPFFPFWPSQNWFLSSWRPVFWLHTSSQNRYIYSLYFIRYMCRYSHPNSLLPPPLNTLLSKELWIFFIYI